MTRRRFYSCNHTFLTYVYTPSFAAEPLCVQGCTFQVSAENRIQVVNSNQTKEDKSPQRTRGSHQLKQLKRVPASVHSEMAHSSMDTTLETPLGRPFNEEGRTEQIGRLPL